MKLSIFLLRLSNENVIVEMKNGTVVQGTMAGCDSCMNIHLKQAKMTRPHQNPVSIEHLTLRGTTVRLIVLPEHIETESLMVDNLKPQKPSKDKTMARGARGIAPTGPFARGVIRR